MVPFFITMKIYSSPWPFVFLRLLPTSGPLFLFLPAGGAAADLQKPGPGWPAQPLERAALGGWRRGGLVAFANGELEESPEVAVRWVERGDFCSAANQQSHQTQDRCSSCDGPQTEKYRMSLYA